MISKEQEKRITDYLISKKLPLDILLEIKDHMISQISEFQYDENLDFETAFSKVRESWEKELKMTSYSLFYFEPIPLIVKKIIKTKYTGILKKSFLIALLFFGINLLLIYLSNSQENYKALFRIQNLLFFITPILVWAFNYKIRKYIRTDFKYQGKLFYTMYQQNMGLLFVCLISMVQIVGKNGNYAYQFFKTQNHVEIIHVLITLIVPLFIQTFIIFGLINFFEHKKSLTKIQGFLHPEGNL